MMTTIEWTEKTWNPIVGCSAVSPGCRNCYAATMTKRLEAMGVDAYKGLHNGQHFNGTVRVLHDRLDAPRRWAKPRMVFVNSMSDLFHEAVKDSEIKSIVEVMADCPRHTFQVLTKRAYRMELWYDEEFRGGYSRHTSHNIWWGISVEDQAAANDRIVELQYVRRNRFVSFEPLLGPIRLSSDLTDLCDWVIIGCESGAKRRPCCLGWVRNLYYGFSAHNIPVFVKQLDINGRVSKNVDEWPDDLRVRQWPKGMR